MTQSRKNIIWLVGGSTGIGKSLAEKLAQDPMNVIYISARSKEKLESLAKAYRNILALPCDITKDKDVTAAFNAIIKKHKTLNSIILNAGYYHPQSSVDVTIKDIKKHYDINLYGLMRCLVLAKDHFLEQKSGHIAIVASVAGYRGLPNSFSYGSTKAALIHMAETLYIELSDKNIKVQVVNPGFVKTPLTDKNDFKMPLIITPEEAADYIYKGLQKDKFEIAFPPLFVFFMKTLRFLPNILFLPLAKRLNPKDAQ